MTRASVARTRYLIVWNLFLVLALYLSPMGTGIHFDGLPGQVEALQFGGLTACVLALALIAALWRSAPLLLRILYVPAVVFVGASAVVTFWWIAG